MSGSKTKYFVDSSCFPIFDPDKRLNHFEAAMLDYTANSPIEQSEYLKRYYDNSRLRNFRGYLNWCDAQGFTAMFGKISSIFYSNAEIDNETVTEALKPHIALEANDVFTVYQTNLNFFSEDFFIRYLATQQGHADWVYQESDADYTISYTSNTHIVATFEDGRVIEGEIPNYSLNSRFLEISYSIIRETITVDPDTEIPTKTYQYLYGFYQYQENTGIPALDALIVDNGIEGAQTYFPVVPIRTNTAWYTGSQAEMIAKTLEYLQINGEDTKGDECYEEIKNACIDGMTSGSINDIDYITMVLGVAINSQDQADQRYLYDFFFNIYANYALKEGMSPTDVYTAKNLSSGNNYLGTFADGVVQRFNECGHNDSYYNKFTLNCTSTNFNYTYSWGSADYFEANGLFKPTAKRGDYGVLSGDFIHEYYTQEPVRDSEGNIQHGGSQEDGTWHIIYESVRHTVPYTLVFFCHQYSDTRWRFTLFVDLKLVNLIYAGKTIETKAHDANMDAAQTATITHNFYEDFPSSPGIYHSFTLNYITAPGDPDTAFIVPLEQETFREVGVTNQMAISYGCQYLVFNCWIAKKVKWYQSGFFSVFLSFVGMVVSFTLGFTVIGTVFATIFAITLSAYALNMTLKILQLVFGDKLGLKIFNTLIQLVGLFCRWISKVIPGLGTIVAFAITFSITAGMALNNGESLWDAFIKGMATGLTSMVAYGASEYAYNLSYGFKLSYQAIDAIQGGVYQGIYSFGSSLAQGESFGESLLSSLQSGILSAAGTYAGDLLKDFASAHNLFGFDPISRIIREDYVLSGQQFYPVGGSLGNFSDYLIDNTVKNPFTYVNLAQMTLDEINFHKLANLENDYQEFANAAHQAQQTLQILQSSQNSTTTSEFVCKLQANMGRMLSLFPETVATMDPDNFLQMTTSTTASLRTTAGNVYTFVDNKLSMDGFTPYVFYYNQIDPTLAD